MRGKCHKPGRSRHPQKRKFSSFLVCALLEVNSAVHTASQKFLIEIIECRASHGSMFPACACVGSWSSWSWHYFVDRMAAPLGMPTTIGGASVFNVLCGALGCKKYPVAPVSGTPVRMIVVEDW